MEIQTVRLQRDEFQALSCIYMDEFQVTKETAPYKFNILCKPYKGNPFDYQINIMFQYTKDYPHKALKYQIQPVAGITRDNINHIIKKIDDIILNSQNQPIVFDIIQQTRNWMHEYLVDGRSLQNDEEVVQKNVQVFQRPKFAAFTPVTVQNFMAWKKQFDAKHKTDKQKVKKEVGEVKITGKQWFLGKHGQVVQSQDEQSDEQIEEQQEEGERVQVENELFQN